MHIGLGVALCLFCELMWLNEGRSGEQEWQNCIILLYKDEHIFHWNDKLDIAPAIRNHLQEDVSIA